MPGLTVHGKASPEDVVFAGGPRRIGRRATEEDEEDDTESPEVALLSTPMFLKHLRTSVSDVRVALESDLIANNFIDAPVADLKAPVFDRIVGLEEEVIDLEIAMGDIEEEGVAESVEEREDDGE